MILTELRAYLIPPRRVAIADLASRFAIQPSALRGMLETFVRKGRVRRVEGGAGDCSGCAKCEAYALEIYEWTG